MSDAALPVRWPLPDGREATLRPIAPGDFAIESAFLDTLSMETSYNRLFSPRHPSPEEIRRWTDIDPAREVAFVVIARDARGAEATVAPMPNSRWWWATPASGSASAGACSTR